MTFNNIVTKRPDILPFCQNRFSQFLIFFIGIKRFLNMTVDAEYIAGNDFRFLQKIFVKIFFHQKLSHKFFYLFNRDAIHMLLFSIIYCPGPLNLITDFLISVTCVCSYTAIRIFYIKFSVLILINQDKMSGISKDTRTHTKNN